MPFSSQKRTGLAPAYGNTSDVGDMGPSRLTSPDAGTTPVLGAPALRPDGPLGVSSMPEKPRSAVPDAGPAASGVSSPARPVTTARADASIPSPNFKVDAAPAADRPGLVDPCKGKSAGFSCGPAKCQGQHQIDQICDEEGQCVETRLKCEKKCAGDVCEKEPKDDQNDEKLTVRP